MKNKIEDLQNHLFAQLERLGDDEAMKNPIIRDRELLRAKAISEVSSVLVDTAKAQTQFMVAASEHRIKHGTSFMPLNTEQKTIDEGK